MSINRNNPLRIKNHCVLAFNDIDDTSSADSFFHYVEGIWQREHLPFSKFGYDAARGSLSFRRSEKKIHSLLPSARSIDISSLPEGVEYPFEYCYSQALFSKDHSSLCIGFESDRLPPRSSKWHDLYRVLMDTFRPKYGYLFQRPFDHGPYLYTVLVGTDKMFPHEQHGRINQWSEALRDKRYLKNGWLREVFPWNFLGPSHLDAPVGDLTLRQWILQSKDRGTLMPITADMMLWDVPDERIAEVGDQLMAAGRVFDYMRDIVAKLPPAKPMSMEEAVRTAAQAFGFESPDDVEIRKGDNTPVSEEEKKRILKGKANR
jgi:hypothetical protein